MDFWSEIESMLVLFIICLLCIAVGDTVIKRDTWDPNNRFKSKPGPGFQTSNVVVCCLSVDSIKMRGDYFVDICGIDDQSMFKLAFHNVMFLC